MATFAATPEAAAQLRETYGDPVEPCPKCGDACFTKHCREDFCMWCGGDCDRNGCYEGVCPECGDGGCTCAEEFDDNLAIGF
jgi:hypothetical protein